MNKMGIVGRFFAQDMPNYHQYFPSYGLSWQIFGSHPEV
jgi:hypothetical protein